MPIIFTNGDVTDMQIANSDITTDPLFPTEITDAEKEAGYEPVVLSNPTGHLAGNLPFIHGVGKQVDTKTVKIKVIGPNGTIRYSQRDRENLRPTSDTDFAP